MKTGMEYPLIGLVVLVALGILWNIYSGMQVDLAVAATNAAAAGTALPAPAIIGGQWVVNAIVGTLIGSAATAFFAWLLVWVRKQIRTQNAKRDWTRGPNAQWGQQRAPKMMGESELYRMMLLQQMTSGRDAGARSPLYPSISAAGRITETDDEPTISF